MRRHVFVRIMNALEEYDDYFIQKRNATGTLKLLCLQKVAAAFWMIANGVAADATDEYVRVGESIALEYLRKFVVAVVEAFEPKYLRLANEHDTARLLAIGEIRGFPGMLGSLLHDTIYRKVIKKAYNYIGRRCFKRPINNELKNHKKNQFGSVHHYRHQVQCH
jgi:hypothetical protein